MTALVRRHPALMAVLAAGAAVRAAVAIAYEPALFFSDSWAYIRLAYHPGFSNDRPSGYPVLIALLTLPAKSLLLLTTVQHLAGLATGAVAYVLLLRLEAPRWAAAAVAALVALDGYAIALEQHVMAEALFTLVVLVALALATAGGGGLAPLAASGLLLGGAVTMRTLGLFAIPALLAYVVWRRREWRALAVSLACVAAPILVYSGLHAAAGKGFGMTQVDGWALYSRVAPFADCDGAGVPDDTRGLCQPPAVRFERPSSYGWDPASPANRLYGGDKVRGNERLREWAVAIVRHQPLDYAEAVAGDFLRFFRPTSRAAEGNGPGPIDEPVLLPEAGDTEYTSEFAEAVRSEEFPGYRREIDPPAGALRAYVGVVHVPRPLMALLALASLAALALAVARRGGRRAPEVLLLSGAGLLMLLGAASVEFQLRYLIPSVPLLACGGTLALLDVAGRLRTPRATRPG